MPGEPRSTRELAHAWLGALSGGLGGQAVQGLLADDFRLNLPRVLPAELPTAGLDLGKDRLAEVDAQFRGLFDVAACRVVARDYDIFSGDRGGTQATLRVRTRDGREFDLLCAATFERSGDALSQVWVHADTAELERELRSGR